MAEADTTEQRKYALLKIAAGDYLLPSNDKRTIWRISKYEDGPSHGLDWPRDKTVWGLWRWTSAPEKLDFEDWSLWEMAAGTLSTREAAIREAMLSDSR